jgi:hypothetical protein
LRGFVILSNSQYFYAQFYHGSGHERLVTQALEKRGLRVWRTNWDNNNKLCISELELIEPELWFRFFLQAAEIFTDTFMRVADQQ